MNNERNNIYKKQIEKLIIACNALNKALIQSRQNEKELKEVIAEQARFAIQAAYPKVPKANQ